MISYLYPVKNLFITGHVLQQKPLQLLAKVVRGQSPFRLSSIRARAIRRNELEFLVVDAKMNKLFIVKI